MVKTVIVILADNQTHGDTGYLVNGLEVARQFRDAGDEVAILFEGAGTKWVSYLANTGSDLHPLWAEIEDAVEGACAFCADVYNVTERVIDAGVPLLDDAHGHPDLASYVRDGYQVITY